MYVILSPAGKVTHVATVVEYLLLVALTENLREISPMILSRGDRKLKDRVSIILTGKQWMRFGAVVHSIIAALIIGQWCGFMQKWIF